MRKIIMFIVIAVFYSCVNAQTGEAIYTISDDNIVVKNKFIDSFYIEKNVTLTPYTYKGSDTVTSSNTYRIFSINLYKFNDYEDEPGVCNVIELMKNGVKILELKSSNGFEKISKYVKVKEYQNNLYFLAKLSDNICAVIFSEYPFPTDIPALSIVIIYNEQAKLVFNKYLYINSIVKKFDKFDMLLQANKVEWIAPDKPANKAALHNLWWDGKVLRFGEKYYKEPLIDGTFK